MIEGYHSMRFSTNPTSLTIPSHDINNLNSYHFEQHHSFPHFAFAMAMYILNQRQRCYVNTVCIHNTHIHTTSTDFKDTDYKLEQLMAH